MKKSSILLVVLVVVLAISCQVQDQPILVKTPKIEVENGRLVFENPAHFAASVAAVDQGKLKISNDKLDGFEYQSYLSRVKDGNVTDLGILSFRGFRVLLNQSKEVQIGDKIYQIDDVTKVFSKDGANLGTVKNSVGVIMFNHRLSL